MITVFLLTIIFFIICHYLIDYIKFIRTGDPNEINENYWRFSYDFKPTKKKIMNLKIKTCLKKKDSETG